MKNLVIFCSLFTIIACSGNDRYKIKYNKDNAPEQKILMHEKKITPTSTEETLKKKYSRLQFVCDYNYETTVPYENTQRTVVAEGETVAWDILEDFSEEKTFSFSLDHENLQSSYVWRAKLTLLSSLSLAHTSSDGKRSFKMANTPKLEANLTGEEKYAHESTLDIFDVSGKYLYGFKTSDTDFNYFEKISNSIVNFDYSSDDSDYAHTVKVNCTLESELKADFKDEFIEESI